ncbi:MAG: M14 family zinc carboxypeptidase [Candidatus Aphodomorpha sp.]
MRKRFCAALLAALLLAGCTPAVPEKTTTSPVVVGLAATPAPTERAGEPTEPPVRPTPCLEPPPDALVFVRNYIPDILVELRYATENNFTGIPIYDFTEPQLRYGTVQKLLSAQQMLRSKGYALKIYDAYRPASAQYRLFEVFPDSRYVANPYRGFSSHSRGNTVDVTLVAADGSAVEMPSAFDDFSALADRSYDDVSEAARAHALLLETVMAECGFSPYQNEWWHFSDTESYPVIEDNRFIAACEEYLSLREGPATSADCLMRIPAGAALAVVSYDGPFALVNYRGTRGYVLASYLMREGPQDYELLPTVRAAEAYDYERMCEDLTRLCAAWPDRLSVSSIGRSELGRDIPVALLGDANAPHHVLMQGAIHGRESITAALLMCLLEDALESDAAALADVCFHVIPMSNPDGVVISQSGVLSDAAREIYLRETAEGATALSEAAYARQWKANALGIDLNRNFDAGWAAYSGPAEPSCARYRGSAPLCAAESRALANYTRQYPFDATISYHCAGSLIYYAYGDNGAVNARSASLAQAVAETTGYSLCPASGVDGAGYKDWAIDGLGIPSLTIEVGYGSAPLPLRNLTTAYLRNRTVFARIAGWLQNE